MKKIMYIIRTFLIRTFFRNVPYYGNIIISIRNNAYFLRNLKGEVLSANPLNKDKNNNFNIVFTKDGKINEEIDNFLEKEYLKND